MRQNPSKSCSPNILTCPQVQFFLFFNLDTMSVDIVVHQMIPNFSQLYRKCHLSQVCWTMHHCTEFRVRQNFQNLKKVLQEKWQLYSCCMTSWYLLKNVSLFCSTFKFVNLLPFTIVIPKEKKRTLGLFWATFYK
jgi:hypothetical protein